MKKILLPLLILVITQFAFASSKEIIDLSVNVQKADNKSETLRIKLPLGEEGTILSENGAEKNKLTVKAIKWKDGLYKINVKLSDNDELLTNSEVLVKGNQEAILQDFDAEGNSNLKLTIKTER